MSVQTRSSPAFARQGALFGSAVGASLVAAAAITRMPKFALGLAGIALAAVVARRWPVFVWGAAGVISLFLDNFVRYTPALHLSGKAIYLSDLVPVVLICLYLSVADLRAGNGRLSLWLAAAFFGLCALTFFRTYEARGFTPALQIRHLLPFMLCATLPLSRRFRSIAAEHIATVLSLLAIAIAIGSFTRIGNGYETTTTLDVERIYQTWEPFIAAVMALILLGYILTATNVRKLHYLGLAMAPVPVLFSFFRTAWVISLGLGLVVFLVSRGAKRRSIIVAGVGVLVATFLLGSYLIKPESGGKSFLSQVTFRASEIHLQLDSYRSQEYAAVWHEIVKHPWIGSGFGTNYVANWTVYTTTCHNAYEWIWWRMGLLGLVLFLLFFAVVVRDALRALSRLERDDRGLAIGLLAGLAFVLLAANLHENFENFQSNLFDCVLVSQLIGLSIKAGHRSPA
jgi:hypothetical protein